MIKKHLLLVSFAALLISGCGGDEEIDADIVNNPNTASEEGGVSDEKLPIMKFETDLYEFGEIAQGEKVSYSFKFKNEGEADLIITTARGSCGCTVPKWPKEPIAPGATGAIDVVFDSNGKSGKQHKQVTIVANTTPSTNVIAIAGQVIAPAEPKPEQ